MLGSRSARASHFDQQPGKHRAVSTDRPRSIPVRAGAPGGSDAGECVELQRWRRLAAGPHTEKGFWTAARSIDQRRALRAACDKGVEVGAVPKRPPVRVRRVAAACTGFGKARPARARRWRMARAADVSGGWIKQMTGQHSPVGMRFGFARGYRYLWWLGRS